MKSNQESGPETVPEIRHAGNWAGQDADAEEGKEAGRQGC